jgi:hypothetical protein
MIITPEMDGEADEIAEKMLAFRSVDDRWNVLVDAIAADAETQRAHALAYLARVKVMEHLAPSMTREQWKKAGLNRALNGELDASTFVHRVRLALAAGNEGGKL